MLKVENIRKSFPAPEGALCVIDDLSLDIAAGEFLCVLGQSGCGKSTLLRILGGFERPDSGAVFLDGAPVTAPSRELFMVFQDYNQLFPWKTLLQNVVYAIRKTSGLNADAAREKALECCVQMGLQGFENSYPHQLSGGMKQRAALARALAVDTRVILMDEPFSNLDYLTRRKAQETLHALWRRTGLTVVFVTHDIEEALFLSSRLAVYSKHTRRIEHVFDNDGGSGLKAKLEALLQ